MKSKIKKSIRIINRIQKIRSANNKNWMDLLKLSLKLDFNSTTKIISKIYEDDTRICQLVNNLKKIK
jgi:hypothetical protein